MKARVKATREIVEVEFYERKTHTGEQVYLTHEGCLIEESRLDFNAEPIDYWTRLEHQYAGMTMQGIISRVHWPEEKDITEYAVKIAHALVQKLKEKEERK